eukprot:scaffold49137_cov34-Phaeocystis_antarctica.AAC.1
MTLLPTVAAPSRRSIPDGACQFTRGMGMSCTWEKERGFGERSWRSMGAPGGSGRLDTPPGGETRPLAAEPPPPRARVSRLESPQTPSLCDHQVALLGRLR